MEGKKGKKLKKGDSVSGSEKSVPSVQQSKKGPISGEFTFHPYLLEGREKRSLERNPMHARAKNALVVGGNSRSDASIKGRTEGKREGQARTTSGTGRQVQTSS